MDDPITADSLKLLYAQVRPRDPLEEGGWFDAVMARERLSEAGLARRTHIPRTYIQQRRQLVRAAPEVQRAMRRGAISFSQARGIWSGAGPDHAAQRRALAIVVAAQRQAGQPLAEPEIRQRARAARTASGGGPPAE